MTTTDATRHDADPLGRCDRWSDGDRAWFECHCRPGTHQSVRTHRQVVVLAVADPAPEGTSLDQRIEDGAIATYWVGHDDGTIAIAHEDELFVSPEFFYDTEGK